MSKVVVQLLTYNGAEYLPYFFESLKKQTYKDWELLVLDNASSDQSLVKVKSESSDLNTKVFSEQSNLGFAGGHNWLFDKSGSEFILLVNQDTYLEPDCLEKLLKAIESNEKIATVAPRLMRWDFSNQSFTKEIDSMGLKVTRARQVLEKSAGKVWNESSTHPQEVFGVSGACMLLRRKAVVDNIFDEKFFSYKEDVDLAFRLRLTGYTSIVCPDAVAYHDRTAAPAKISGDLAAAKNKKKQPNTLRFLSYRNHLLVLFKNEQWSNFILDFPFILWYELKKFVWFLFFDIKVLKAWMDIWRGRKNIIMYRKQIGSKSNTKASQLRRWWH